MYGSFTDEEWKLVYEQAYKYLGPGGWIEQIEPNITYVACPTSPHVCCNLPDGHGKY